MLTPRPGRRGRIQLALKLPNIREVRAYDTITFGPLFQDVNNELRQPKAPNATGFSEQTEADNPLWDAAILNR